jgi:hypothetical protein
MATKYDLIVIGSGPGGYVAAIRASQLGLKTAVVEKAEVGGVCLNWGCIPTKALIKSAQVFEYIKHASDYGITMNGDASVEMKDIVKRSRDVAAGMSKGIQFLFKKNKIDQIKGFGKLKGKKKPMVVRKNKKESSNQSKKRKLWQSIPILEIENEDQQLSLYQKSKRKDSPKKKKLNYNQQMMIELLMNQSSKIKSNHQFNIKNNNNSNDSNSDDNNNIDNIDNNENDEKNSKMSGMMNTFIKNNTKHYSSQQEQKNEINFKSNHFNNNNNNNRNEKQKYNNNFNNKNNYNENQLISRGNFYKLFDTLSHSEIRTLYKFRSVLFMEQKLFMYLVRAIDWNTDLDDGLKLIEQMKMNVNKLTLTTTSVMCLCFETLIRYGVDNHYILSFCCSILKERDLIEIETFLPQIIQLLTLTKNYEPLLDFIIECAANSTFIYNKLNWIVLVYASQQQYMNQTFLTIGEKELLEWLASSSQSLNFLNNLFLQNKLFKVF